MNKIVTKEKIKSSTFDAEPCLDNTINDLDVKLFKTNYLSKLFGNNVSKQDKRTTKQQLASLHLYNTKHDCPTVAGILILGKKTVSFFHGRSIQYVKFEGFDSESKILNERQFSGNLITMLKELNSFINHDEIIKELIVNNVMHRDYQTNTPSKFYEYADRIEIDNPGSLYGKVMIANFPNETDYRNPILAKVLKKLGYANCLGCGINRIQELLRENENGQAIFNFKDSTTFKVILIKEEKEKKTQALYPTILYNILKNPSTTSGKLYKITGIKVGYMKYIFSKMKSEGLLERIGPKDSYWKLTEKGIEIVRKYYPNQQNEENSMEGLSKIQNTILQYITENPYLTTETLAQLVGIKRTQLLPDIELLKHNRYLNYVGDDKNGYWKIDIKKGVETMQERSNQKNILESLGAPQNKILACIINTPDITINKLLTLTKTNINDLTNNLLLLENNRFIKRINTLENGYWEIDIEKGIETMRVFSENQQNYENLTLNLNQHQRTIFECIAENPDITTDELALLTSYKIKKINEMISQLQDKEMLERIGDNHKGYWKVTRKHIPKMKPDQKLVLEHIAKNLYITKNELALGTGLQMTQIYQTIAKLKEQRILTRVGSNKDGYWKIGEKDREDASLGMASFAVSNL